MARILTRDGRVRGVALEDGTEIEAARVASNADAHVTFLRLLDPAELPADFAGSIRHIDYSSPVLKINVALSELPNFTAYPTAADGSPGPQHRGTIHICPDYGLPGASLRRRQVRPAVAGTGPRVHDRQRRR